MSPGFIINNDLTVSSEGTISFGIDEDGNYGYKKVGADAVTPFKTGGVEFSNSIISATEIAEGDTLAEGTLYIVYAD